MSFPNIVNKRSQDIKKNLPSERPQDVLLQHNPHFGATSPGRPLNVILFTGYRVHTGRSRTLGMSATPHNEKQRYREKDMLEKDKKIIMIYCSSDRDTPEKDKKITVIYCFELPTWSILHL